MQNPIAPDAGVAEAAAKFKSKGLLSATPAGGSEDPAGTPEAKAEPKRPTATDGEAEPLRSEPEPKPEGDDAEASADDDTEDTEGDSPIDAPVSWSDADKEAFASLPPDIQKALAARESERESLLTRSNQDTVQKRREYEALAQEVQAERQRYEQYLRPLIESYQQELQAADAALDRLLDPNDPTYDPTEYMRQKARADRRREQIQAAQGEHQRMNEAHMKQQALALKEAVADAERRLIAAVPEWGKDQEKGRKEIQAIRDYAKAQGVDARLADQMFQPEHVLIARKAMLYDKLMASKPAALKKAAEAPKVSKPGVSKPKRNAEAEQVSAARTRLRRTGDFRDAAPIFRALLKR